MPDPLPAISLVAVPGRRRQTLDLAREIERRGFSGIYMPSRYSNMAQCTGLALATERIRFGTAIAPIYAQTTEEFAAGAAYIHEVSGGRFRFGIGVAHGPMHQRLGITQVSPLPIPARLSRSSNLKTASAPCPQSFSPRCASGWWRYRPRSPKACCSPMPAYRI